jgi:dihydroorotate dehydrogenase
VIGVAAGFDKDARIAPGLACLGFGHVEIGTLTPYPQFGNPKPRVFRLPPDRALINRMGFPNDGVAVARARLAQWARQPRQWILGVSLGKQKETALSEAADDYVAVMQAVFEYADYLAVNVSSPNTPGLRELQGKAYLASILERLQLENGRLASVHSLRERPILVKIAPDLLPDDLNEILDVALALGVAGAIATNTTVSRPELEHRNRTENGGLSGAPLAEKSNEIIDYIRRYCGDRLAVIGAGGVFTVEDIEAKLDAGASVVQLYTGLVYEGPRAPGRLVRQLRSR